MDEIVLYDYWRSSASYRVRIALNSLGVAYRRVPVNLLEGAHKVFMEHGYEGASVDEIARAAGTSKATLYSYFPDKRQLFEAVVQAQCSRTGKMIWEERGNEPIERALRRMAVSFASFLFSPGAQEMFRVCIAESGRFPEAGAAFYAAGPARAHARLVEFFQCAAARGELAIDDPAVAADQFAALCKAGLFLRALLGAAPATDAEIARVQQGPALVGVCQCIVGTACERLAHRRRRRGPVAQVYQRLGPHVRAQVMFRIDGQTLIGRSQRLAPATLDQFEIGENAEMHGKEEERGTLIGTNLR